MNKCSPTLTCEFSGLLLPLLVVALYYANFRYSVVHLQPLAMLLICSNNRKTEDANFTCRAQE